MDIYVVMENEELYLKAFMTYADALSVVKTKFGEEVEGSLNENLNESPDGKTYLYVEKGIHIWIYRLPVD
jgi:hypothetical protein